jgi:nucleoside-diphosphate kinase
LTSFTRVFLGFIYLYGILSYVKSRETNLETIVQWDAVGVENQAGDGTVLIGQPFGGGGDVVECGRDARGRLGQPVAGTHGRQRRREEVGRGGPPLGLVAATPRRHNPITAPHLNPKHDVLRAVTEGPHHRISTRGNASLELLDVTFRITDPTQRVPWLRQRPINLAYNWAELLWYMHRFAFDVRADLIDHYVGSTVTVALAHGDTDDTAQRVRALLGHYDPDVALKTSIRGHYGIDSAAKAAAEGRFIRNLIHSSDHAQDAEADFRIWFGEPYRHILTQEARAR